MKVVLHSVFLIFLVTSCQSIPLQWKGSILPQTRDYLKGDELSEGITQPLIDMSYFSKPKWAKDAIDPLLGTLILQGTQLNCPKGKDHYPGENLFRSYNYI